MFTESSHDPFNSYVAHPRLRSSATTSSRGTARIAVSWAAIVSVACSAAASREVQAVEVEGQGEGEEELAPHEHAGRQREALPARRMPHFLSSKAAYSRCSLAEDIGEDRQSNTQRHQNLHPSRLGSNQH
eukprot:GHVT01014094.1.p1 GENE.GHVT01014094.1~~GHVT01014094.1.p1  ORF type:complete len:130 (+),score=11.16 GHVT01014094.1:449-838(+)